jgi:hypothetical protein
MKRALVILATAAALFFISDLVQGIGYRRTTQAIIDNRTPTVFDAILGHTTEVLMFPMDALVQRIPAPTSERPRALYFWTLYLGDCLLWAIVLYSIVAFLGHYRRTRDTKSP